MPPRSTSCLAALGLVVSGLLGCAIPSSRSNIVVVTDNKAVIENCTSLGQVDGSSAVGSLLLRDSARDSALARLKARAAELDGTHVLSDVAAISWKGPDTAGAVYRCATNRGEAKPG